jgi:hypothetical protein
MLKESLSMWFGIAWLSIGSSAEFSEDYIENEGCPSHKREVFD